MTRELILSRFILWLSVIGRKNIDVSRVDETIDGVVIVKYEVEMLTILRGKHRILDQLVGCCVSHQIAVICRHRIYLEMLPLFCGKSLMVSVHSVHPCGKCVQVIGLRSLGVGVSGLECELPSLLCLAIFGHIVIEVRYIGKQANRVTIVQHLPALHPWVVKVRNILESKHLLGWLIVIEVVLTDEDRLVCRILAIEHEDRESINSCTDIILISCCVCCLLCICSAHILAINLHVVECIVPHPCNTCIMCSRWLCVISLETPTIHRNRSLLERIQLVRHYLTISIIKNGIRHFLRINTEVLLWISHWWCTLWSHRGTNHLERPWRILHIGVFDVHNNLRILVGCIFQHRDISCYNHHRKPWHHLIGREGCSTINIHIVPIVNLEHICYIVTIKDVVVEHIIIGQSSLIDAYCLQFYLCTKWAKELDCRCRFIAVSRSPILTSCDYSIRIDKGHSFASRAGSSIDYDTKTDILVCLELVFNYYTINRSEWYLSCSNEQTDTVLTKVADDCVIIVHICCRKLKLKCPSVIGRMVGKRSIVNGEWCTCVYLEPVIRPSTSCVPLESLECACVVAIFKDILICRVVVLANGREIKFETACNLFNLHCSCCDNGRDGVLRSFCSKRDCLVSSLLWHKRELVDHSILR